MRTLLATTAAAVALPAMAFAVPLPPNETVSQSGDLGLDEEVTFAYEPTEELNIDFSMSGSGILENLQQVTYNVEGREPKSFDDFERIEDGPDSATGILPQLTTGAPFEVISREDPAEGGDDSDLSNVSVTISAEGQSVQAPAPIPLPAAGFLLGGGVFGLGAASRLKRKLRG